MKQPDIEKLRLQQKQLAARIKLLESRARTVDRKRETRRKVLLGALLQSWMKNDPEMRSKVEAELPGFLTRKVDRDVFGLPASDEKKDTVAA